MSKRFCDLESDKQKAEAEKNWKALNEAIDRGEMDPGWRRLREFQPLSPTKAKQEQRGGCLVLPVIIGLALLVVLTALA